MVVALLMVMTAAVYASSLGGGFVYEDTRMVPVWQGWAELQVWTGLSRRLVAWVTCLRSVTIGDSALAQRSLSLGLHLVNGGLFWAVARRRVEEGVALVACALMLLHPLNTEAVAYAGNLSGLLVATAVLLAIRAADAERVWLAWGCAALATLAKEPGLVAFLLVPALCGPWSWRRWGLWMMPAGALGLLAWPILANEGYGFPHAIDVGHNLTAYGSLLTKWMLPVGFTPMPDWWWMTPAVTVVGVLFIGAAALAAIRAGGGRFVALIALSLAPRLLWWLPGGPREHHLYLASMVLSVATAVLVCPSCEVRA